MATINRSTLVSQLIEGIKRNFGIAYNEIPMLILKFFDEETSNKNVELYQEVGGFGLHIEKAESAQTTLDVVNQGPQTVIKNVAFALGYQISHEAMEDNLYPQILRDALDLGFSARTTVETVVTDRLNTGFSGAAADLLANGQPLFSTAQPLSGGGGTVQNRPTVGSSLSEASLTIDMNNIANFRDPRGKRILVTGEMLVVPQALDVQAQKLMQTTLTVGSNNNDLNPFGRNMGRLPKGHVTSQFLTDDDAYFIRTNQRGLVFQKREMPARIMEDVTIRSMVREVISYMRFGVAAYDFRSVYANPGA